MLKASSRSVRTIILGLIGISLATLIVAGIIIRIVRASLVPADFLPSDRTVALLHRMTEETMEPLRQSFPVLRSIPPETGTFDVAVLAMDGGRLEWVVFEDSRTPSERGVSSFVRGKPLPVIASSQEAEGLLIERQKRLASFAPFRALMRDVTPVDSWIFLSSRLLPPPGSTSDFALSTAWSKHPYMLVSTGENRRLTLYMERRDASSSTLASFSTLPLSPTPAFTFSAAEPTNRISSILSLLSDDRRAVLQGLVRRGTSAVFGDGISPTYDLAPFLKETATLYFAPQSGSGGRNIFLVEGSSKDPSRLETGIEKLRAEARQSLSLMQVKRRSLDRGFTSTIIGKDPAAIEEKEESRGGWLILSTMQKEQKIGLWTATKDSRFILTNDVQWLRQATAGGRQPLLPQASSHGMLLASILPRSSFEHMIRQTLSISTLNPLLSLLLPSEDSIVITYVDRGTTVTFEAKGETALRRAK